MNNRFHFFALICLLIAVAFATTGCTRTVYEEKVVEVKVPVAAPCVVDRPAEPISLRDTLSREEWDSLTTDQRENLMAAQALLRKVYGDRLTVATAGCR